VDSKPKRSKKNTKQTNKQTVEQMQAVRTPLAYRKVIPAVVRYLLPGGVPITHLVQQAEGVPPRAIEVGLLAPRIVVLRTPISVTFLPNQTSDMSDPTSNRYPI